MGSRLRFPHKCSYTVSYTPMDFEVNRKPYAKKFLVTSRSRSKVKFKVKSQKSMHQLNSLLKPVKSLSIPHSPSAMASFFENKVKSIRMTTAAAPQSNIVFREVPSFSSFGQFSVDDVLSFIRKAPDKQCILDPLPTSILKQCSDLLAPALTSLVNLVFEQGFFPDSLKHAVVQPVLKKT